jgi:hypothetical protein
MASRTYHLKRKAAEEVVEKMGKSRPGGFWRGDELTLRAYYLTNEATTLVVG